MSNEKELNYVAYILKLIAHPYRLKILMLLLNDDEITHNNFINKLKPYVHEILINHHLSNMKLFRVLKVRKENNIIYYSIKNKPIFENLFNTLINDLNVLNQN